jgi:1,2-diacylglycerol 3-alpha-glucosyltransferase
MKIAMFTNTFTPHIGGVARSVSWLAKDLRDLGHDVLVVAPEFPDTPEGEKDIVRIPALQNVGGSDFSMPLPLSLSLHSRLERFAPDLVHSHHPFLLGDTALRVSAELGTPSVFTYHTRYDLYGHYVAQDSPLLNRILLSLSLGYCALCDAVVAPSESIAEFLNDHQVKSPVTVIPTGIDPSEFRDGDGRRLRQSLGIPEAAFVAGHVGRLAPEKNLDFLVRAVLDFLSRHEDAHFVVAGRGPMLEKMAEVFSADGVQGRVHLLGERVGEQLADVYGCMDAFAFSSLSETQGLVLAEAMTAGVPVAALDAPGAREIVADGVNGRLLASDASTTSFSLALSWLANRSPSERQSLREQSRRTAGTFSRANSVRAMLALYVACVAAEPLVRSLQESGWQTAKRELEEEWKIWRNIAHAVGEAVL